MPRSALTLSTCAAVLLLLTILAPVCRSGTSQSDLDKLRSEIVSMIGDARATDIRFCRTIAFGSKPCGGPWEYLVFSTQRTDSTAIASRVDRYNALESQLNNDEGRISDCALPAVPELHLTDGSCTGVAP